MQDLTRGMQCLNCGRLAAFRKEGLIPVMPHSFRLHSKTSKNPALTGGLEADGSDHCLGCVWVSRKLHGRLWKPEAVPILIRIAAKLSSEFRCKLRCRYTLPS